MPKEGTLVGTTSPKSSIYESHEIEVLITESGKSDITAVVKGTQGRCDRFSDCLSLLALYRAQETSLGATGEGGTCETHNVPVVPKLVS